MITSVAVRNWQSLRSVDLVLGRFTVIVGASSSGKSALLRALRAAASNVSGTAAVSRGADAAAVTVRTTAAIVTLEYAKGAWRYRLVVDGTEQLYTKLNRSVPEAVTRALRIAPVPTGGASINFAGQFDRPYLLAESGATVARELGELTNVDTVFAAVREANRRRANVAATLRSRRDDLARLVVDADRFTGLRERLTRCERAEATAERAARLHHQVTRLSAAAQALDIAETVLAATVPPDVPTDTAVVTAQTRLGRYHALLRQLGTAQQAAADADRAATSAAVSEQHLHDHLHELLVRAGTCPTCRQAVVA